MTRIEDNEVWLRAYCAALTNERLRAQSLVATADQAVKDYNDKFAKVLQITGVPTDK